MIHPRIVKQFCCQLGNLKALRSGLIFWETEDNACILFSSHEVL